MTTVLIDDYKLAEETDYYNAWKRAKDALPNGGTIIFGIGTYSIDTPTSDIGWFLEKDNIILQGAGIDKTILTASPDCGATISNRTRLAQEHVRGFLSTDTDYTFTYDNATKKGDKFLKLKSKTFCDLIPAGSKVMITGGSHYFDQEFGELATVTGKSGDKLLLKDGLSGMYDFDSVPNANRLAESFPMPLEGEIFKIKVDNFLAVVIGRMLNVGDNIFVIKGSSAADKTITLVNIGKGNAAPGTIIEVGTPIMKGRTCLLWDHTKNLAIKDLTILGQQDRVLRLDNTYTARITRVKIIRTSWEKTGFIYTTDFCRDIVFDACTFTATGITGASQVSRSSGDITFKNCRFNNVRIDLSEFCFNIKMQYNIITMNEGCYFILGNTVRKSYITNNIFNLVADIPSVIMSGEIQNLNHVQREYALIDGNTFNIKRTCGGIIDLPIYGQSIFSNNKIKGGTLGMLSNNLNRIPNGTEMYATDNNIIGNIIQANFTLAFLVGGIYCGKVAGNTVVNTGAIRSVMMNWKFISKAVIENNSFTNMSAIIAPPIATVTNNTYPKK